MKGINVIDRDSMVAIGRLEKLPAVVARSTQTAGLPSDIPVLTCPVAAMDALCFASSFRHTRFGFGRIPFEDRSLMTIRMQHDGIQIYWVAEMSDPEIWAAIDMWRRFRRVPVAFKIENGDQWQVKFCAPEIPSERLANEQFRMHDREPNAHTWHGLASVVGSGLLQLGATSDIPGVALRHVFVNALLTERLKPFAI